MLNESLSPVRAIEEKRWFFLITLTLVSVAGLVGSDLYLPVLPAIGSALKQNSHAMQLTLGIYLFGLSLGQILLGPLSDHFGRKRILILGMTVYLLASLSCVFAFSYYQLLISRLFQALGACSGLVVGRAVIGDKFDAKEAGKVFSTIFPFVGMSPAISPVIGGLLGYHFGWRSTFIFIAFFALLSITLVYCFLQETLEKRNRARINLIGMLKTYPILLKNKSFLFYASAPCVAYVAYFAYIAQSPFIFHSLGYGEYEIGFFYITLSLTYVSGNLLGRRLLSSLHINRVLKYGYLIFNIGAFCLFLTGYLGLSLWVMVVSISILTFGNGFLIPLGTAGVVSSFSGKIGYASGLLGFLQLGVAALSSTLIGIISHNAVFRLGIFILLVTLFGFLIHLLSSPEES